MELKLFEDKERAEKTLRDEEFSPYFDFRYVDSTITKGVRFGINVKKPEKPSYLVIGTHGWHMSISKFQRLEKPVSKYLEVEVDMRGRAFSNGDPDCNGYELYDVYDAVQFVLKEYKDYLLSTEIIYFEGGSGGGGNALAIAGKFPDLFSAVNALCPIGDYAAWYKFDDKLKEFRDEMDVWIGCTPEDNMEAYDARSGITVLPNLMTNLFILHGNTDYRVPYFLTTDYIKKAKKLGKDEKIKLITLHGVGTRQHYGNATKRQLALIPYHCQKNIDEHKEIIEIPPVGEFVVGGYLVTKHFGVFADIDKVFRVQYDLKKKIVRAIDKNYEFKVVWYK